MPARPLTLQLHDTYLLLKRVEASYQGERPEGVHWFLLEDGASVTMTTRCLLRWGASGHCIHIGPPASAEAA